MGNWRDRFEKSINQKTGRKLSVYFELYEGAWISADSSGIWRVDRGEINIICFFQNQAVGAKRDISEGFRHRQEQSRFYSEVSA